MRSALVTLGPMEWPAIFAIAGILLLVALLWRKLERAMGDEPPPLNRRWYAAAAPASIVGAVVLWLLINRFAPVHVRSYGVMLLTAFVACIIYLSRTGPPRGFRLPIIIDSALVVLISCIIGARLMFVLLELGSYREDPLTVMDVWQGGLSFHGGLIGALLAMAVFVRKHRMRWDVYLDLMAPVVALGYAITRIGCFLRGCCHGNPTDLPWGVVFPENIREFPMPVHPTQLYASAGSLAIMFLLIRVWPRLHRPGQLFALYVFLYSILRFLCEITRRGASAEDFGFLPAFSVAQAASILTAIAGLIWFLWLQKRPHENPVTASILLPEAQGDGATETAEQQDKSHRKAGEGGRGDRKADAAEKRGGGRRRR